MTIDILFGSDSKSAEWQTKSFSDENKAIEWCRRNHYNILAIGHLWTGRKLVSHFVIMEELRGNLCTK